MPNRMDGTLVRLLELIRRALPCDHIHIRIQDVKGRDLLSLSWPDGSDSPAVDERSVRETQGTEAEMIGPLPPQPGQEENGDGGVGRVISLPLRFTGARAGILWIRREPARPFFSSQDFELASLLAAPLRRLMDGITDDRGEDSLLPEDGTERLIGRSRPHQAVLELIRKVRNIDAPVFIAGESGTGKELVARTLHSSGRRRHRKFVAVNCGAIPDHLLESELFGFVRGAFTGAVRSRAGLIEEADGGTFFLDEIADLTLRLQAKLLRLLQEKEVRRIGENSTRAVDVRFVSATNRDLDEEVEAGRFRRDLYYRVKIIAIDLPPLRRRREDIPLLLAHFVDRACRQEGRGPAFFSPEAASLLVRSSWPGNIRELQNEVQRCLALCGEETVIRPEHLSERFSLRPGIAAEAETDFFRARASFEKNFIREALLRCNRRGEAARELGLSRQGLYKLIKKHDIGLASGEPPPAPG